MRPVGYHHHQWLCGNSCTWAHDVRLCTSCALVHELLQSHCGDNQEGAYIIFNFPYIYMCVLPPWLNSYKNQT